MEQKKNEVNKLYEVPDETQYTVTPVNSPMKDKILGRTPQTSPMNLKVLEQNSLAPEVPNMQFRLGDIGNVSSQTVKGKLTPEMISNANSQADRLMVDAVIEGYKNKLAPEQTGQVLTLMERLKQGNQPKQNERFTVGDGQDIVERDSLGNYKPVYSNKKDVAPKDPKYMWHKIGEGIENGKEYAIEENIVTGERRKVELGEKRKTGTTVNVNTEPDVSKLIGEITTISRDIENGKLDKETSDRAYAELEGKTEELVDRYGLKGATNLIWQRINKGRTINEAIKDVDDYQTARGQDPFDARELDYLRLYFNSRIVNKK